MLLNRLLRTIVSDINYFSLSLRLQQGTVGLRASGVRKLLLGTLSQVPDMQATHSVKPPNVLVFQPARDSTSKEFIRVKEALETCLSPEHYVVYPLGVDDVLQRKPWKENCRLVVVPPTEHAQWKEYLNEVDHVMKEMLSFISNGGTLLSMHNVLNSLLGLKKGESSGTTKVRLVQATSECGKTVQSTSQEHLDYNIPEFNALDVSRSGLHDNCTLSNENESVISRTDLASSSSPGLESSSSMERNTNHCNNIPTTVSTGPREDSAVCVQEVIFGDGVKCDGVRGCRVAVVSSVDILPSLPFGLDMRTLVCLKRDVKHRQQFLSVVLRRLGLECSTEQLPQLTHSYLVCSAEVGGRVCLLLLFGNHYLYVHLNNS